MTCHGLLITCVPICKSALSAQVQQFVAGRHGDRGSLILQMNIHEASRSKIAGADAQQQAGHRSISTSPEYLRFCILQMVPWYFRLLYHTMQLTVNDKVTLECITPVSLHTQARQR